MFLPMSVAIVATTVLVAADEVPRLNVEPSCRVEVSRTVPNGDMEVCLENERSAREQLVWEWTQFTPADKTHCLRLSTLGGEPSYTDLLTCLELERDARNLREKDRGTAERQIQGNQMQRNQEQGNQGQADQAPEHQRQGH
jgi:hypothetical protein